MGKSKASQRLLDSVGVPPDSIKPNEIIISVLKARGNSLYECTVPESQTSKLTAKDDLSEDKTILLAMPPRFRNTIFVKRGGFVVAELYDETIRTQGKVKGDLSNIVTNKKDWQRYPYWPVEFKQEQSDIIISDDDQSDDYQDELHDHDELPDQV
jgi:probable RNA-binding protein EIF1AD